MKKYSVLKVHIIEGILERIYSNNINIKNNKVR